ncbi:MAG TPA: phage holin family protein [Vicinamibacteria bacterium]|nr:phage holin family protein [Vicinamibacteria bacterium]
MDSNRQDQSLGTLLRELTHEVSLLFRQEIDLAKTEMAEKATLVGRSLAAIALGGAIALLGGLALLAAVIIGLGALLDTFLPTEIAAWLSPLVVGGALAYYGYSRIQTALDTLRSEGLVPTRTKETLQENTQWLKARIS